MKRKIKKTLPQHIVIPDTNILWSKDKRVPVGRTFEKFIDEYKVAIPLVVAIPYIVRGELAFQKAEFAKKSMRTAKSEIRRMNSIIDESFEIRVNDELIRKNVLGKIDGWIERYKAKILKVPIGEIDWDQIVERSLWRHQPFVYDENDYDKEKGFRDALILETVTSEVKQSEPDCTIIFISRDDLLRKSVEDRVGDFENALVFEDIDKVRNYFSYALEEATENYVRLIMRKAMWQFNSRHNARSLFQGFELYAYIEENEKELFDDPLPAFIEYLNSAKGTKLESIPEHIKRFQRHLKGKSFKIDSGHGWNCTMASPSLIGHDGKMLYKWQSFLKYARHYFLMTGNEDDGYSSRDMDMKFDYVINWNAKISSVGSFLEKEIVGTSVNNITFELRKNN